MVVLRPSLFHLPVLMCVQTPMQTTHSDKWELLHLHNAIKCRYVVCAALRACTPTGTAQKAQHCIKDTRLAWAKETGTWH